MNAKEYLEQVKRLDELIKSKLAEREMLIDLAEDISAKPLDGIPYGDTGVPARKMENAVIRLVMLTDEINATAGRFVDYLKEVLRNLEKLPEKEYGALHRHYIQYKSWERVAEEMGYCTTHIWRIHRRGLKILQDVIECNAKRE